MDIWRIVIFGVVNYAKEIYELEKLYWEGIGIKKDLNEAVSLYELASEFGYERCLKMYIDCWGNIGLMETKLYIVKTVRRLHGVLSGIFEYEIKEGTKFIADVYLAS